ncbi:MAG: peptidyl-prolyl cis-trans isomerase [Gallionellaceae bacterium]|nr:MAG: peptidyl-prolyl cis-trans isomerase [Gallionellaceae bacterium]
MLTDLGEIVLELDAAKAPISVANFLAYVNDGFYNGTNFHRVISNFMIQGGGYAYSSAAGYQQKATNAAIALEKTSATGLSNLRGSVAMARTSVANSATSQFFINVVDNLFLDAANQADGNGYAVFGSVISGMSVVDQIKIVPILSGTAGITDQPATPVFILWAYQIK